VAALNAARDLFNEVASLYDDVRPGYSMEIIDEIAAFAALPADARILEIGCGTGQITLPFAERGYRIVALEPGEALAAIAARKSGPYPGVHIVRTSFEAWPLEPQAFDLVLAAQSFHWIAAEFGCARAASALKLGGAIALVWHLDISQDTPFWQATQPIYDLYQPTTPADEAVGSLAERANHYKEALVSSEAFADVREVCRAWDHTYAGPDYLKLLNTYSDHRALPEPARTSFFQAMGQVIEDAGGIVHRKYETLLLMARAVSDHRSAA
jgi:SAM-dependent methyltransferase